MLSGFASALNIVYLVGSLTVQSYICQPPSEPILMMPVDGTTVTTGSAITVSGQGPQESSIIISDNGTDVASVQSDNNDSFSASIIIDSDGEHTLAVKATRSCGVTQGNTLTITATSGNTPLPEEPTPSPLPPVTSMPPVYSGMPTQNLPKPETTSNDQNASKGLYLSVKNPINGSTTTDSSVFVRGVTNSNATVTISVNGTAVASTFRAHTSFGLSVPLSVGENTITVNATGSEGTASVTLSVTRLGEERQVPWYQTPEGQQTIRAVAIGSVVILIIIVIIMFILL